jgi:hypothetical protein
MAIRAEEEFVLTSVATAFGSTWESGDDPPDGYLVFPDRTIAVEVTTLTQHVSDGLTIRPRMSDDAPALRLANELNEQLFNTIPRNRRVMLVLSSPIHEFRKTKAALAAEITSTVARSTAGRVEQKTTIRTNQVEIYVDESDGNERKKIVAAVMNRNSNSDVVKNVAYSLENRIRVKAAKCGNLRFAGPIWLALLNDFFYTDIHTCRYAMKLISVQHPFERVLLVARNGTVETVIPSTD